MSVKAKEKPVEQAPSPTMLVDLPPHLKRKNTITILGIEFDKSEFDWAHRALWLEIEEKHQLRCSSPRARHGLHAPLIERQP